MTPLRADSTGKGTRMRLASVFPVGTADGPLAISNCHSPLRFIQSLRTICGRGYSGWTLSGVTSLAHLVISGPLAGCQSSPRVGEQSARTRAKTESVRIIDIAVSEMLMSFPLVPKLRLGTPVEKLGFESEHRREPELRDLRSQAELRNEN